MDKKPQATQITVRHLIAGAAVVAAIIAVGSAFGGGVRPATVYTPSPQTLPPTAPELAGPQAPEDQWIEWKADDGAGHYQAGPLSIDVTTVLIEDLNAAKVTLTDAAGARAEWTGDGTSWSGGADIALVRLAPTDVRPRVLLSGFSGGVHCCSTLTLMSLDEDRWTRTDLGSWDGDTPALPKDLDGDGVKEFAFVDQVFLYAFASYAESWAPPVVKALINGELRDLSEQRRFRPVFAAAAERAKTACMETSNGACAGYVASAARAGKLDEAWAIMLRSYDQASDWTLPTACRVRTAGECPVAAQLTFGSFPEALQWFLGEHGYTPPVYVEPLQASGPSFDCGRVTTDGELAVCADGGIATLDRALAVAFARAAALSRDRSALQSAQRMFLDRRNQARDVSELTGLYQTRIDQLLAIE